MQVNTPEQVVNRGKIKHTCSSCGGMGYTHHQRLFKDGYELDTEQNCLICHGKGEVFS